MTCHQPIAPTGHGWTPERRVLFLDRLAANGNARAACRAVGLSAEAAYRLRRRDPLFARGWAAAVLLGRDASVQALADRAVEGIVEDVWYRGEVVGTRRRYDTRLLLVHLARLDALADEDAAGEDAARFDRLLASIGKGESEADQTDRLQFICDAGERAARETRRHELTIAVDGDDEAFEDGQPRELAEDEIDDYFGENAREFREGLEETCEEAQETARRAAAKECDRIGDEQCAAVDALCKSAEAQVRAANAPLRLDPNLAVLMQPQQAQQGANARFDALVSPPPASHPWTVSTVSTPALASAFAEPPRQIPPVIPPRGKNRRSAVPPRR